MKRLITLFLVSMAVARSASAAPMPLKLGAIRSVEPPNEKVTKIKYKTDLHSSYLKYLEKGLREKFGFTGTPIKIYVSKITNA